jgi:hypothetical protein
MNQAGWIKNCLASAGNTEMPDIHSMRFCSALFWAAGRIPWVADGAHRTDQREEMRPSQKPVMYRFSGISFFVILNKVKNPVFRILP